MDSTLDNTIQFNEQINEIENFVSVNIIKHFVNALNSLILVEMDGKEWGNKKERQSKIVPYFKDKNNEIIISFNTNDFLINKLFPLIKSLDAYGTAIYDVNGINVTLLNTYNNNDKNELNERYSLEKKYTPIITFCYIYNKYIEVADIVLLNKMLPRKRLSIHNHMIGIIPKELRNLEFSGKEVFCYYPSERFISLRVKTKDYKSISQIYKHKDSEDWMSSSRVKIHLELVT
jgi:hypothetical protein